MFAGRRLSLLAPSSFLKQSRCRTGEFQLENSINQETLAGSVAQVFASQVHKLK
jgi:hypothetical protein